LQSCKAADTLLQAEEIHDELLRISILAIEGENEAVDTVRAVPMVGILIHKEVGDDVVKSCVMLGCS